MDLQDSEPTDALELGDKVPPPRQAVAVLSPQALERGAPNYAALLELIDKNTRVDEVADIGDRAYAAQVYYRQSRDKANEIQGSRIRVRAERRLGELLQDMLARGERAASGKPSRGARVSTLAELGITYDDASRAQQLAEVPEPIFQHFISQDRVINARRILRETKPRSEPSGDQPADKRPEPDPNPEPVVDEALIEARVKQGLQKQVIALLAYLKVTEEELQLVLSTLDSSSPHYEQARSVMIRVAAGLNLMADA